ncbi:CoA-disulfide reductase [Enterococcus raffinosus]|uniref:CoA-disulfide reductase n=1 Tax=Enterococcus raffinosus TaxID=71452 RepID=UPI001C110BEA|nr:CoA-disulfide reductase [Enterococcus raffinosus]MBU5362849.1 CoA-disulfide reductase [Enterococcus raffinosus]
MSKKIIIIGGVAGGATAATRLRRLNEEDEIILFEKGEYISFANCGLPYHIGGTIKNRDDLLLQTVDGMSEQYGLDIRNFSEVTSIHPEKKIVTVTNHQSNETYEESYDSLIISTGAKAIVPPIEGLNTAENVFSLRNIPDMDKIKAFINEHQVKKAAIIGGGFIGLEMMENLVDLGIHVQLVEMSDQVMPNIDFELAQILHAQIDLHGVKLILGDGLKAFQEKGKELLLNSGKVISTELTILSIGVTPENTLAKKAGLELGLRGAIKVNDKLETSIPGIYAIGDVIEVTDFVNENPTLIPLAWPANRQGRLVADIINGIDTSYKGTQGTSVAKIFELTAASTGNSEKVLQRLKVPYKSIHIHPNSHAGYYPDASPIALKLLFGMNGKILGAQGVGTEGVEKRIDVISTAMKFGAKADELASIELAYAPPYSSAKDPVNMLGYTADNLLSGRIETVSWSEVKDLIENKAYLLDIREEFERATGELPNSHIIPLSQLRGRLDELPKDQIIYVYCQVGLRGYNAARILTQNGFRAKNIDGGYKTYKQAHYEVKKNQEEKIVSSSKPMKNEVPTKSKDFIQVDACGLQCPGPILKVKESVDKMKDGQKLEVQASDFGFVADIEAWCKNTGNTLLDNRIQGNKVTAIIAKGTEEMTSTSIQNQLPKEGVLHETKDGATMVVFSGDLDKALASMIIASGAAAMGKKVTIFFTFWGLSILKKKKIRKNRMAKMFDLMLPAGANNLPISKMNMGGLGAKMIKSVMKQKNVDSLPLMIKKANELDVKFVACTMSMDIMGIERDELFDFVEYGGVATYLGDTKDSNLNLFI